ncbi:MAG: hypothetical protein JWO39_1393 [Gemmatimonadetes bacterium]|nr:hypothetical protein [Gemmatimonadota bacterium]
MFLELVDSLRCVRPHEDSWLVARADELVERHIVRGELGCPVCEARYAVRDGIVDFAADAARAQAADASRGSASTRAAAQSDSGAGAEANQALALRAAALLGLTEPGGLVVLVGEWTACACQLLDMIEGVQLLALNPAQELQSGGPLSLALIPDVLPLAAASARGIALDAAHATPSLLAGAARALVPSGRLIAPASTLVPESLRELARDDEHWVAAANPPSNVSAPVPIALRR